MRRPSVSDDQRNLFALKLRKPAVNASTGFFVKPKHSDKCYLAEQGREEFIVYDGSIHTLKRNGQRGGSTMWHMFRCNCLACEAVAYVRWDVLMVFVAGMVHASKEQPS